MESREAEKASLGRPGQIAHEREIGTAPSEVSGVGRLIPLTDVSRRPVHFPAVTICIIVANFLVFALELNGGEAFVLKWAAIPEDSFSTLSSANIFRLNQSGGAFSTFRARIFSGSITSAFSLIALNGESRTPTKEIERRRD